MGELQKRRPEVRIGFEPTMSNHLLKMDSTPCLFTLLTFLFYFNRFVAPPGVEPDFPGWKPGVLTDRRWGQIKSVKDSSYLRPRIPIRLNFTNLLICNSSDCQVTTHTEPFTAFSVLLRPYRIRTCVLRLSADALTARANRRRYLLSAFLFVTSVGIEPTLWITCQMLHHFAPILVLRSCKPNNHHSPTHRHGSEP